MKIEIELSEVEGLKGRIDYLQKEVDKYEEKLKSLDEKELKKKAVALSKWLFDNYMECVFRGLGFNQTMGWERSSINFPDNIEQRLGKDWWRTDHRIKIDISANVSKMFKQAFLSIGVNPDVPSNEDTLEWVEEETTKK